MGVSLLEKLNWSYKDHVGQDSYHVLTNMVNDWLFGFYGISTFMVNEWRF